MNDNITKNRNTLGKEKFYRVAFSCALILYSSILTAVPAASVTGEQTTIITKTAIVHELKGITKLFELNRDPSRIKLNQKFIEGNILGIGKDALVEITYNNGCSEIVGKEKQHEIDACACQTSPFRKGIQDLFNATLNDVIGEVLIFQGDKYVPATENMRIRNGDRIMTMRDATAKISYDGGCKHDVATFAVQDVDGCLNCPLNPLVARPPLQLPTPTPAVPAPPAPVPAAPPVAAAPPPPVPPVPVPPIVPPPVVIPPVVIPPLVILIPPLVFPPDDKDPPPVSP